MGRRAAAHGSRRNLSLIYCLTQGVQSSTYSAEFRNNYNQIAFCRPRPVMASGDGPAYSATAAAPAAASGVKLQ